MQITRPLNGRLTVSLDITKINDDDNDDDVTLGTVIPSFCFAQINGMYQNGVTWLLYFCSKVSCNVIQWRPFYFLLLSSLFSSSSYTGLPASRTGTTSLQCWQQQIKTREAVLIINWACYYHSQMFNDLHGLCSVQRFKLQFKAMKKLY